MLKSVLFLILCYFIGNFSPAYVITKLVEGKDIRQLGSGNAGSTNVLRNVGKKGAAIVFILDFLKGAVCTYFGMKIGGYNYAFACAFAVVLGHVFPVLLGFRGGKGVATIIGAIIVVKPLYVLIGLGLALLSIWKFRYVSLGSLVGVFSFAVIMLFTNHISYDSIFAVVMFLFILYTHRTNVSRLLKGEERKLGAKSK